MSLLDGVGHVGWWGLSPSQDLTTYCTHNKGAAPLRVLCVGANDLRHVLEMVGISNISTISTISNVSRFVDGS